MSDSVKSLQWQVNSQCNLNCKHCFWNSKNSQDTSEISLEQAMNTIDILKKQGLERIDFTLVEPMLNKDIFKILDYCAVNGLRTTLLTNGILLNENIDNIIKSNIDSLGISFSGISAQENDLVRGKGTFDIVIQALKNFIQKRNETTYVPVVVYYTLSSTNFDSTADVISFFNNLGVDKIVFNEVDITVGNAKCNSYLKKTDENTYDILAKSYSKLKDCKIKMDIPGLSPFQTIYLNLKFGINLPVYVLSCGILGGMFFVNSNNKLKQCMFAGKKDENILLYESDVNNQQQFWEYIRGFEKNYVYVKKDIQQELCGDCIHFSKCNPCIYTLQNGQIKEFSESCKTYRQKIEQLIELFISQPHKYTVGLRETVYLVKDNESVKLVDSTQTSLYRNFMIKERSLEEKIIKIIQDRKAISMLEFLKGIEYPFEFLNQVISSNFFCINEIVDK